MQIWHFILILFLIAAPSGFTWLYLDSQRESEEFGLFGDINAENTTTPFPPIFWEDPISVEPKATDPTATITIIPDDAIDRIKKDLFSDILEDEDGTAEVVLPPVEEAIRNPIVEEDSEEDIVAEP